MVVSRLPEPIRQILPLFRRRSSKDVWITASLGVLSGCLPNTLGRYDTGRFGPNLYVCITAPAASGKGVLKYARSLGEHVEELFQKQLNEKKNDREETELTEDDFWNADEIKQNNKLAFSGTASDLSPHDQSRKSKKKKSGKEKREEPMLRRLFLSGDISSSALIDMLDNNGGFGTVFETEIDTLTKTQKQDWGGTSDTLRKGHAHETVSYQRVGGRTRIIQSPRLSVVLAGTPRQVLRLIPSPEDGLFSRFLFFGFLPEDPLTWKDVRPRRDIPELETVLDKASSQVMKVWTALEKRENPLNVTMQPKHWDKLNKEMQQVKAHLFRRFDYNGNSTAHRAGLHIFRLTMILAVWRAWEEERNLTEAETVKASDDDFETALSLGLTYAEHAAALMRSMPRETIEEMTETEANLYERLDSEFETAKAVSLGKSLSISERTVYRYLKIWVKTGRLLRVKRGRYRKPRPPEQRDDE